MLPARTILDGATGTELARRGVDTRGPLFSAKALLDEAGRVQLRAIHREYLAAGAEVITAATFRTTPRAVLRAGYEGGWAQLLELAVAEARAACAEAGKGLVAGSMAPLEDCYRPDLRPSPLQAHREHALQATVLREAGCDLLLVETVAAADEGLAALEAALSTGLPTWVSAQVAPGGTLPDGSELSAFFRAAAMAGAQALLVNCTPPDGIDLAMDALARCGLPFGAYAHFGETDPACGWTEGPSLSPVEYAERASRWAARGALLLGGCCGTTPAHIAQLARLERAAPASSP